jgi:class 3 adenylate cyclase
MDTVGDAYVVVGFLRDTTPQGPHQDGGGGENGACDDCYIPVMPGPSLKEGSDSGNDDCARASAAAAVCGDVLAAARAMILALRDYRRRTGSALHCRVGVSLGDVVAGVLGHLQPRCAK